MLQADLEELDAGTDSELARHLLACETCRSAAQAIRTRERELGAWLARTRPRTDVSVALARAAHAAGRLRRIRTLGTALTLAAAAVLGAVVLLPRHAPSTGGAATPALADAGGFSVATPPGRDLIVLHTANPKIVVVWYLPTRRT
jgi:hypothetical protein